jgi:CRP/FNR family transcriptional regulator, cyclic AMP receptor protein
MIDEEVLNQYNAKIVTFEKEQLIFFQGAEALNYYQVRIGEVKMAHYNSEGQEFIQGIFEPNSSFGEPALFGEFPYPCGAVATKYTEIFKLPKTQFFKLLEENFIIHKKFNCELSKRLRYKGMILNEISSYPPAHRIQTILKYMRVRMGINSDVFEVPYTRQQLADMTGLRVETVIKTIKKLEADNFLKIKNRKVILE